MCWVVIVLVVFVVGCVGVGLGRRGELVGG